MPTNDFLYPEKPRPGDKVAILSPSSGLPEIFSAVFELGLQRLREEFGLVPVEYPTTRKMNAPLEERARDIHAAFADPAIKAVICSIGGEDQIKLLKYLDAGLLKAHPKPFFGYSDNTNLHIFLWNLRIVSYHGGSIMVQFDRSGAMHPYTRGSLKYALFEQGMYEIVPSPEYSDEEVDWGSKEAQQKPPVMFPNSGWKWHNAEQVVEGITWGGCLEIVDWHLRVNRYLLPEEAYQGKILYLETSEELPPATYVYRMLMCMGERRLLQQFAALLFARPKAWSFERRNNLEEKRQYIRDMEEAVLAAIAEYHPHMLAVFNMDFGHTDPQFVIPNGGKVRIDGIARKVAMLY